MEEWGDGWVSGYWERRDLGGIGGGKSWKDGNKTIDVGWGFFDLDNDGKAGVLDCVIRKEYFCELGIGGFG